MGLRRARARWRRASACRSSTTTTATPPPCMPTTSTSEPMRRIAFQRVGHRRHRAGWRGDRGRRRHPRGVGPGGRARPRPDLHRRPPGRRSADADLQLRESRRRGEHRVADRDRAQPAPLLADPVPRSSVGRRSHRPGGQGAAQASASTATRWRSRSSSSRPRPSAACSPSPPTSPIRPPTSWVAAWSRPRRISASGSSSEVRANTTLREEQAAVATFALVPDRDMAGARGSAFAALASIGG